MSFAQRLTNAMENAKPRVNQKDLAEKAGISQAMISKYLSGDSKPREEVIKTLANILGCNEYWLASGQRPNQDEVKVEELLKSLDEERRLKEGLANEVEKLTIMKDSLERENATLKEFNAALKAQLGFKP